MAYLLAEGAKSTDRWRRRLPVDRPIELGREGDWAAPWDQRISRRHLELRFDGRVLHVRQLPEGRNPVFWKGSAPRQFSMRFGEHFVVGGTTFTLSGDTSPLSDVPAPIEQQTFSTEYLHRVQYRNAEQRIEILNRLPELITAAVTDGELFERLVNMLLLGAPRAAAAALVEAGAAASGEVRMLHWDRRRDDLGEFRPSARLVHEATGRGESVLHAWKSAEEQSPAFTVSAGIDWAFCTPIPGAACRGWGLYVAGRYQGVAVDQDLGAELRDDIKFAETTAAVLAALREARMLQQRQAGLGHFFSPVVLEAVADADPDEVLAPREATVSVLFCDLRGFSRQSEREADDLFGLLNRVSRALGVTTHQILTTGGVVGDFHGDAAMGFWGWPLAQPDAAARATQAALSIRAEFQAAAADKNDPLHGFQMGIGIATGPAVAGKIGTIDQVKVTVFGPVVNLASRLEGLTKLLHAPILVDPHTIAACQTTDGVPHRFRRLAVVRPANMDAAVEVAELLPPADEPGALSDAHVAAYEAALDAWKAGDWETAFDALHEVPARDRAKDFLTVYIAQHNRMPPPGWDGAIRMTGKG